jgi:hypothetical protein
VDSFTKIEMQTELRKFLKRYAEVIIDPLYGTEATKALVASNIEDAQYWDELAAFYDFGILGQDFGYYIFNEDGEEIFNECQDLSKFFENVCSGVMKDLLENHNVELPIRAALTIQTAIARFVLEGGKSPYYTPEYGNYLSIGEVALLANMDERSVRNAANPKLAGALKTITKFKRSLVAVKDAQVWLNDRKGFVPTVKQEECKEIQVEETTAITLLKSTASRIQEAADKAKLSVSDFLEQRLTSI